MTEPTHSTDGVALDVIEREVGLAADLDRVWRAVTDPDELGAWFGATVELAVRPGAKGWFTWLDVGRHAVRVEAVEPGRRFAFRWAATRDVALDDGPSTLVEFEVEPGIRGGSVLRVRESGFTDESARSTNVLGWLDVLSKAAGALSDEPWHAGVRRTYTLRSPRERVWRAFADPAQFGSWWAGDDPVEIRAGAEGWWVWPGMGRFAVRVDAVEPERYIGWRWTPEPDVALGQASTVLRTEWVFVAREDGGTDLHLLETGFERASYEDWKMNSEGWDGDVVPGLRRVLGEEDVVSPG